MGHKRKYALVGTGGRSSMFIRALGETFREDAQLVGLCDLSQTRMDFYNHRLQKDHKHPAVLTYPETVFAMGELKFYGRANAAKRGEKYTYDR